MNLAAPPAIRYAPPPMEDAGNGSALPGFGDLGFDDAVVRAATEAGYGRALPVQAACAAPVLAGRDVVVRSKTGSGKTAAFVAPLLHRIRWDDRFPQILVSGKVRDKPPIEALARTTAAIRAAEAALGEAGRVNVRYSGTSALVRVMVEGEDEGYVRELAEGILAAAGEDGILA